jgi:hypothetical protein
VRHCEKRRDAGFEKAVRKAADGFLAASFHCGRHELIELLAAGLFKELPSRVRSHNLPLPT